MAWVNFTSIDKNGKTDQTVVNSQHIYRVGRDIDREAVSVLYFVASAGQATARLYVMGNLDAVETAIKSAEAQARV